jgi:uncharacterized delta-60 repeat protein
LEGLEDRAVPALAPAAGALDPDFDIDGRVRTNFSPYTDETLVAHPIARAPGGKIVVAGTSSGSDPGVALLARYNPDGSPDDTFGTDGLVTLDLGDLGFVPFDPPGPTNYFGTRDAFSGIAVDSQGRVVLAGCSFDPDTGYDFAAVRLNPDGSLDTSFDFDGRVSVDFGSQYDTAIVPVFDAADRLVLVGNTRHPRVNPFTGFVTHGWTFAAARLDANGAPDLLYGTNGRTVGPVVTGHPIFPYVTSAVIDGQGRLVVAGDPLSGRALEDGSYDVFGSSPNLLAARLNPNGTVDTSFGDGGVTPINFFTDLPDKDFDGLNAKGYDVAVDPAGQVVMVASMVFFRGSDSVRSYESAVIRLTESGSLDPDFGDRGRATISVSDDSSQGSYVFGVAAQSDGKIVAAGHTGPHGPDGDHDFLAVRLAADGSLDASFGDGGRATADFGMLDGTWDVVIQPDGTIVAAGTSYQPDTGYDFAVARYLGDRPNVTSLPNAVDGATVTLQSPDGTTLVGVQVVTDPPPGLPANAQTPVGHFDFQVHDLAPGATVTVTLYMPSGVQVNQYWKYGTGGWFDFHWNGSTGARFEDVNGDGTKDIILTIVDGQRGDDDGVANGIIVDPGAPVLMPLRVQIDAKPGDAANRTTLASQGVIPVAILGSADFDAALVDPSTVLFANARAFQYALEDVNGDGRLDLILHFRIQDTILDDLYRRLIADDLNGDGVLDSNNQTAEVSLTGFTTDDTAFAGSDSLDLSLSGRALRDLLDELAAAGAI